MKIRQGLGIITALTLTAVFAPSHAITPTSSSVKDPGARDDAVMQEVVSQADEGTHTLVLTDQSGQLTQSGAKAAFENGGRKAEQSTRKGQLARLSGPESTRSKAAEPEKSDYLYLSQPVAVPVFSVAGITWDKGQSLPLNALVEIRTLDGETWSPWYALGEEDEGEGRPGTEMNISGRSTGVQVRISGEGDLPSGLTVNLINGNGDLHEVSPLPVLSSKRPEAGTDTAPSVNKEEVAAIRNESVEGVNSTSFFSNSSSLDSNFKKSQVLVKGDDTPDSDISTLAKNNLSSLAGGTRSKGSMLTLRTGLTSEQKIRATQLANIQPRSAWGADESLMEWKPAYSALQGAIIHHTAGSNTYTKAQVPAIIRGIYSYHAQTREWGDIGYNVLVDKYGGRWEGRKGTLSAPAGKMVTGAHAVPRNVGTLGVSVMGNYTGSVMPNDTVITSLSDVIAASFAIAGVDPASKNPLTVPTGRTTALPGGSAMPRIAGHKDVGPTACPGNIYAFLDDIREKVGVKYAGLHSWAVTPSAKPTPEKPEDVTPDTNTPTVTPTPEETPSRYFLSNTWSGEGTVSFTYGTSGDTAIVGDWNGDGKDTVSLRRGRDFAINNSTVPQSSTPHYNLSYGRPDDEYFVGDWDGDGIDTLAVRRGNTFYVKNSVTSGVADRVFTYGRAGDTILVGDWNGDGKDTFVVRRGKTYLVRNTLTSGVAESSFDYGRDDDEILVGHFAGDSADSLAVRRGFLYYISYSLKTGPADRVVSFGREADRALVGDWNGDRVDTLGVRRG